jgi:hypothetical protein
VRVVVVAVVVLVARVVSCSGSLVASVVVVVEVAAVVEGIGVVVDMWRFRLIKKNTFLHKEIVKHILKFHSKVSIKIW